jgi:lysophospholipase L1-like esterase
VSQTVSRIKSLAGKIRTTWDIIGVSLLILVALEATCRVAVLIRESRTSPTALPIGDVYDGAGWIDDYAREFEESLYTRWHDFVYWRRTPYHGEWINVDDRGVRKSWNAAPADGPRPVRIFFFGGSTMWGSGARDDYTIPSCVARDLTERGLSVEVTNFGESGYVSKQELIALVGELESGNVPDLVVFYDGVNDTFSTYQNGQAGLTQNEPNRRAEFNILRRPAALAGNFAKWACRGTLKVTGAILRRLTGRVRPATADAENANSPLRPLKDPATAASQTIEHYRFVVESVKNLGRDYDFDVLFYWQPTLFQKQSRTAFETQAAAKNEAYEGFFQTVYTSMRGDAAFAGDPQFHNLSEIFARETQPLFIDFCHIGEQGNELIARTIADDIYMRRSAAAAQRGEQ